MITPFKKYKTIFYCANQYSKMIFMILNKEEMKNVLFLEDERTFIRRDPNIIPNHHVFFFRNRWDRYKNILFMYLLLLRNRRTKFFLVWLQFYVNLILTYFKHIEYIEDGTASYLKRDKSSIEELNAGRPWWIIFLYGYKYPQYEPVERVKSIYMTGILPIPQDIAPKVKLFSFEKLWCEKSSEQQREIIRTFLPDSFDFDIFAHYEIFLLTQPFSEYSSGNFSEAEKIEVYHKLIAGYDETKIVIKSHPCESTDYRNYFPKALVIQQACPFELFFLMGFLPRKVITVSSTSLYHLPASVEKVIGGYRITPALVREAKRREIFDTI